MSRLEPDGHRWANEHLEYLRDLMQEPETLRQILALARQYGINRFEPLARGYESAVFDTDAGKVMKIGPQSRRFYPQEPHDYQLPSGVWGVMPNERTHILGEDRTGPGGNKFQHDWNIFLQDRVNTAGVDAKDRQFLEGALNQQGYGWRDSAEGNMGFASSQPYRPVVIDGLVQPLNDAQPQPDGTVRLAGTPIVLPGKNFIPPTTRPWVLAALATGAGGALSLANQGTARADNDTTRGQFSLVNSGRSPIAPPQPQLPYTPPANTFESVFGTDLDATSISQRELDSWYADESYGYGGGEHQQYIKNVESLMDEPLIPVRAAAVSLGMQGLKKDGGDVSLRQAMANVPFLAYHTANMALADDPGNPQKRAEAERMRVLWEQHSENPDTPHPVQQQVLAVLTGQRADRSSPYANKIASKLLDAVKAGTRGGKYENDPSITTDELASLEKQYGEEANRMLTQGGVANARREAAYDLLAAIHSGADRNPIFDNPSTLWSMFEPDARQPDYGPAFGGFPQGMRGKAMYDKSAIRGRMTLANDRFARANQSFGQQGDKPYVVNADNFNRLDPGSYQGLMRLSENASWPYARNFYHTLQPLAGDAWARQVLADSFDDDKPYQFQVDMLNMNQRETPVRFPRQTPQDSRQSRAFVQDRLRANAEYLPTHTRPMLADMFNSFGNAMQSVAPHNTANMSRKPYNWERVGYSLPYAIATSPPQVAMVGGGAALAAAKAGTAGLRAAGAGLLKEVIDENLEDAMIDPANADPTGKTQSTSWMRPYAKDPATGKNRTPEEMAAMFDPDNKEAWDRGVSETNARREQELREQYSRWKQATQR